MVDGEPFGNVAIVTLQGRTNYGNRLQNYAVTKLYEQLGYQATTLIRENRPNISRRVLEMLRSITCSRGSSRSFRSNPSRLAAFEKFDSELRFLVVSETDADLAERFDYFSVGSDQVWNLGRMSDNDNWFYLRFARFEQRIALAPSIGVSQLDAKQMKRLARGVSGFRTLSIRERKGADLIKESSGREAEVICDPTLVLSADEWRAVSDTCLTPKSPYVLAYLLGDSGFETVEVLERVTQGGFYPVVPLSDKERPGEPPAGPAEFISLIDNAVHVVTDSFHAAVFASILQTPLTVVRREGGASMFSRLETLCQMLGIEHKVYGSPDFDLARAGDYAGVPGAIECERKRFADYLGACLNA